MHSTKEPTDEEKKEYVRLFVSKSFQSYIKIHNETIESSKCKDKVDVEYIQTEKMLNKVQNYFISERFVDYALGPLRVYNPDADDFFQMKLQDEKVKIKFFACLISFSSLNILPRFKEHW